MQPNHRQTRQHRAGHQDGRREDRNDFVFNHVHSQRIKKNDRKRLFFRQLRQKTCKHY